MAQTCQVDSMTRNLELCGNLGVSLGDCVKMLAEGLGWLSDIFKKEIYSSASNCYKLPSYPKHSENHCKKMIVAVIIFSTLVLQPIRVILLLSTISKSTTGDTTPTQSVAKPIVLVLWTRTNLMVHAVLPIQCVNMMLTVSRNISKMFSLKHFVEINIMYWFILVELVYTGKFTLILSLLNLKLALVHLWGRV